MIKITVSAVPAYETVHGVTKYDSRLRQARPATAAATAAAQRIYHTRRPSSWVPEKPATPTLYLGKKR